MSRLLASHLRGLARPSRSFLLRVNSALSSSASPPAASPSTLPTLLHQRGYASSSFESHPAPPRLPPDQQAEFERLQRAAAVSSALREANASFAEQQPLATSRHVTTPTGVETTQPGVEMPAGTSATANASAESSSDPGDAADPNGGVWRGAPPEFDGDINPKTGEVGGPKNEPLRWGAKGDWSYNGRVTDF